MDAKLVLLKKDGTQKAFALPSNVTVIGRRHDCDLRIPLATISRRHCQLHLNNGTVRVRDLGSRCGTLVNGRPITKESSAKAGDRLTIGPLTFVVQIDGKPEKITAAPPAVKSPAPKQEPKAPAKKEEDDDIFADLDASGSALALDDSDLKDLEKE